MTTKKDQDQTEPEQTEPEQPADDRTDWERARDDAKALTDERTKADKAKADKADKANKEK